MKKSLIVLALLISVTSFSQDWGTVDKNEVSMKEIAPVWPGCESNDVNKTNDCFDQKLGQHISENFKYPANAWKKNIQGRVVVKFIINTKGEVEVLNVEGENKELKDEARRNIMAIPKMKAGMLAGKPKAIEYTVPFTFKTGK